MPERKIFNFESKVLVEKTLKTEGYHPDQFGPGSAKFIWATCRFCGEPSRIRKGFFNKAGSACHKECRFKEQSISGSPFARDDVKEKSKKTNLLRYGSEFASQSPTIGQKISATKLTKASKEKTKQTNIERYGVENVFESEEIKKKIRDTNLEKYGHNSAMQNEDIKKKTSETLMKKYDVPNLRNHKEFLKKAVNKFKENIKNDLTGKFKTVNTLRYDDDFWDELATRTLTDVCKDFDLEYQTTASTLSREEFKEKFQNIYSFPKCQKQQEIISLLGDKLIYKMNDKEAIKPFELDILISEKNFAIEFNGSYWHSEAVLESKEARNKHISKTKLCREKGIRLFHVFEYIWDTRKNQILNFIKSSLGLNKETIFARKCVIDNKIVPEFIDNNHIQKCPSSTIKFFNLVYNGEVVGSMTAAKHHRQNASENDIVLSRLCFKDGVTVVGGASKLFAAFKEWAKIEGYKSIISWSDSLWTEGNIYKVLGFALEEEYGPDYFYWDAKNNRYLSKQSQKKSNNGCPADMTERDWCYQNGLFRIWDCGKKKWCLEL